MKLSKLAGALLEHLTPEEQEALIGGGAVPLSADSAHAWPAELPDSLVTLLREAAPKDVAEARAAKCRNRPGSRAGELDMWVRDRRIGVARALLRNPHLEQPRLDALIRQWGSRLWAKKDSRSDFLRAVIRWGNWQEEWWEEFHPSEWVMAATGADGGPALEDTAHGMSPHPALAWRILRAHLDGNTRGGRDYEPPLSGRWWVVAHRDAEATDWQHDKFRHLAREAGRKGRLNTSGDAYRNSGFCYDCSVLFAAYAEDEEDTLLWAEQAGVVRWDGEPGRLPENVDVERLISFYKQVGETAEVEKSSAGLYWWYYNDREKMERHIAALRGVVGDDEPVSSIFTYRNFHRLPDDKAVAALRNLYGPGHGYAIDRAAEKNVVKHPAWKDPAYEGSDLRRMIALVAGDEDQLGYDDDGWRIWAETAVGGGAQARTYLRDSTRRHNQVAKEGAADRWLRQLPLDHLRQFDEELCAGVLVRAVKQACAEEDTAAVWGIIGNLIDDWAGSIDDLVTVAALDNQRLSDSQSD